MKLLADVGGEPLLARTVGSLIAAGLSEVVVVVAPDHALDGIALLRHPRVRLVMNPDPSRGMFSSIREGLLVAQGDPVVILPADMPFVTMATIASVVASCVAEGRPVVPAVEGRRGHPLALPASTVRAVVAQPANSTLKEALLAVGPAPVELAVDDRGALRDVDVPADLDQP